MSKRENTIKLTKHVVKNLPSPDAGQKIYYDSELPGFGIRITKNSKTYIAERRVKGKGRVRRVSIESANIISADTARDRAIVILSEMRKGLDPVEQKLEQNRNSVTLAQAFDDFIAFKKRRPSTLRIYRDHMNRAFRDWRDKPVIDITRAMVCERHRALSSKPNKWRGCGEAYANQAMIVLRAILNFAKDEYSDSTGKCILSENPVRRLSWNKISRRQSVIQMNDFPQWYQAVIGWNSTTVRDYLLFCLFTGLRRKEAATLKWDNIDFKNKTLTVLKESTKNHEQHTLPLSDFLLNLLKRRTKVRDIRNDYLFPGDRAHGHLVDPKFSIRRIREQSGVRFTIHDLRRTFITIAESLNIPHYALKKLANHKNRADVTEGYIVSSVERLRPLMQEIADRICDYAAIEEDPNSASGPTSVNWLCE